MKNLSVRELVLISLFAALTAVLSYVSIPLPWNLVPVTGQTLAVMLSGALLGAKSGALSQVVYLLLGAVGLPVFAGGTAGLGIIVGPTGGFLLAFPLGAFIIGKMLEKNSKPCMPYIILATAVGGVLAIYIPGILQLMYVTGMGLSETLVMMLSFILGDIAKIVVSSIVVKAFMAKGLNKAFRQSTDNAA